MNIVALHLDDETRSEVFVNLEQVYLMVRDGNRTTLRLAISAELPYKVIRVTETPEGILELAAAGRQRSP